MTLSPTDRAALQRIARTLTRTARQIEAGNAPERLTVAAALRDLRAFIRGAGR
ncbi:hypothetical protein [Microvirga sesbaniae]|uniref:hypothetical protein n=1 Tax=Microvirga sesbaniae TaxID=681392 RepID=UPI0021C99FCB|nr:hypothetical protein [Microvirga sp. HBU67692]